MHLIVLPFRSARSRAVKSRDARRSPTHTTLFIRPVLFFFARAAKASTGATTTHRRRIVVLSSFAFVAKARPSRPHCARSERTSSPEFAAKYADP